jgi:hypothetical protein
VDVKAQCLVRRDLASYRHTALSYVWGHTSNLMTMTGTLNELLQPVSLAPNHALGRRVPRTGTQVIGLICALGEQYIWIDALSIVQDDPDKTHNLNAMASIYAHPILTIVAANGRVPRPPRHKH